MPLAARTAYLWMAPELLQLALVNAEPGSHSKSKYVPHKIDVYSYGCVIWEILYRRLPWLDLVPSRDPQLPKHIFSSMVSLGS